MAPAAYDEIADWYEHEFLAATATPGTDPLGIGAALGSLLGRGTGACLEIGCGTGLHAGRVRSLGWTPLGIDISTAMLQYTRDRLPATRADAIRLPVRDRCLPAVIHRHGAHRHARLPRRADRGGPGSCSRAGAS
jgi:SAM-dependent methyltransferase